MNTPKRYHPLIIIFDLFHLIKNCFFFFIFLFVIKYGSVSPFFKYGRIAFIILFGYSIVYILLKWYTHKYKLEETSFYISKGIFLKTVQTIPFTKIQNINRRTSFLHKIFQVTSIRFETGMSGDDSTVEFKVISPVKADQIENYIKNQVASGKEEIIEIKPLTSSNVENDSHEGKHIHFRSTKKDILKASLTSFSFLLLIPLVISIYSNIDDIFHVEAQAKGVLSLILHSRWVLGLVIIILIILSFIFGIVKTTIQFGNYEISSDDNQIYIKKGYLEETIFTITKSRVQAVEINQSLLKRILGLAEVRLISAGNTNIEDDKHEVNSLFPFLSVSRAYDIITEILPSYEITKEMKGLPKRSLCVRLLRPSWFWLAVTFALYYFKPTLLGLEQIWWVLSFILLIWIYTLRVLDFYHTQYTLNEQFIQLKKGSFHTSLFISKRNKIIEIQVKYSFFQKYFGLASITTVNRAKPVHHNEICDVPADIARMVYKWYQGRTNEIELV
ncbi:MULTISPECIES: PH domain-containing protein [Heyndrickxia]|nr:PH domain-containing protein [Heyndrickxia oleronia]MBU5210816.1 PH domain-containing protein [Heyndrickxia oleronia]MCI1613603.1 PH domain-containing protein [Heyndrickxia oleronia]MCI1761399.1 PH domain-containing protein [Heyndrickxia oleronia]MCM3457232.1 PH domain-containing protein [Heyndrickxia oleronia]